MSHAIHQPSARVKSRETLWVSNKVSTSRRVVVEAILATAFIVGAALLMWGSRFAENMVHDQLSDQNITFPAKGPGLDPKTYPGLQKFAGQRVDSGEKARAYADQFIKVHLRDVANGQTYSEVSGQALKAHAAVTSAKASKAANLATLEEQAAVLDGQTQTLFRGETLRGLLLYAWGWSLLGDIAWWVSIAAGITGVVLFVLASLGADSMWSRRQFHVTE